MDLLVPWGVANITGFIFKPILEEIAKLTTAALEDYVKNFFGVSIKNSVDIAKEISLKIAFGKAIKEFLGLVQQELEDADVDEIKQYKPSLKEFIGNKAVLEELGKPLQKALGNTTSETKSQAIDTTILIQTWNNLTLKDLPKNFNWQQLAKRYVKKLNSILRDSDELQKVLDSANLAGIRETLEQLAPISPDFDFTRYQDGLMKAYDNLKLDSLDTSGSHYTLKLWNIFVGQKVLEESSQKPTEGSVFDLLNNVQQNYKYTVILGNPGSGKSTLAQYKAIGWARNSQRDSSLQELPLLIELRNYIEQKDNCNNFLEYLHKGSGLRGGNLNQQELEDWLKNQSSIVMFDGLDEVLDTRQREQIAIDIINFSITYPKVRVLVTSRVIGYEQQRQKFRDANFRHFMLQDLDDEQISNFVTQWHKLAFGDDDERNKKRDRLQKCIENSPAFRELAGNPLLLTMMAILNRHEELPRDRATLYEHASMVLLQKWDAERNLQYKDLDTKTSYYLDYKAKQDMLRQIAYKMQSDASVIGNSLVITRDTLEKVIANYLRDREFNEPHLIARVLLKQLTDRSFILCFMGGDSYSFVHRTFLEYFCAWHFVWEYEHEKNISLEYLKEEIFAKRWTDEAWREIIILITGKISEKFAAELIDSLLEKDGKERDFENLLIASECLQNVRNRSVIKETDKKLLDTLKDLLTSQSGIRNEIRNKVVTVVKDTWQHNPETLQWVEALAQ